jgi:putative ABC transport system permease protein
MSLFSSMSARVMMRSFTVRKGRTITALLALTTAAAVTTAMLNLYVDLEAKLSREFRKVGANVLVTGTEGGTLPADAALRVQSLMRPGDIAVPVAYAVIKSERGTPIVAAGIDMEAARRANGWWQVAGDSTAGLIGVRAAEALKLEDDPTRFHFNGKAFAVTGAGTLRTGGPEDSRIYIPLEAFEQWTGVAPSVVELSMQGSASEVESAVERLRTALPQVQVRPIRQVAEAETRVLAKTKAVLLASAVVIIVLVAVCVIASLTASVLERRKDFAVMKALGSSQRAVGTLFLAEAVLMALAASLLGFAIGSAAAAAIGRLNFHAAVMPRAEVFPPVLLGVIVVALLSSALPLARLQKIEPAVMLKGD